MAQSAKSLSEIGGVTGSCPAMKFSAYFNAASKKCAMQQELSRIAEKSWKPVPSDKKI